MDIKNINRSISDAFMQRCADYVETHRDELEANPDDAFVQRIMKEVIDEHTEK